MPEPMSAQDFHPHPICRELVARLNAYASTKRRNENALYRGPHGGTPRTIRSELGRRPSRGREGGTTGRRHYRTVLGRP
jgi:hypothetical protein